jgi:hypothetical protein
MYLVSDSKTSFVVGLTRHPSDKIASRHSKLKDLAMMRTPGRIGITFMA